MSKDHWWNSLIEIPVVFLGKADKLKWKKMAEKTMMKKKKNKKEEVMHSVMQIMIMVNRMD